MTTEANVVATHPDAPPVEGASPFSRKPQRLPLTYFPDSKLMGMSKHISNIDQETKDLASDLIETMHGAEGVGLAAIQVGKAVRLFVMKRGNADLVLVNPVWFVTEGSKLVARQEGCLSFPGVFEMVERYDSVEVLYQDLDGAEHRERLDATDAHVVQHETEHLDGHLFIEHLPIHKRTTIRQKMKQRSRLTSRIDKATGGRRDLQAMLDAGLIKLPARAGFRGGK